METRGADLRKSGIFKGRSFRKAKMSRDVGRKQVSTKSVRCLKMCCMKAEVT